MCDYVAVDYAKLCKNAIWDLPDFQILPVVQKFAKTRDDPERAGLGRNHGIPPRRLIVDRLLESICNRIR